MVSTILAGSFSLPLRRPLATASRTAFSISRCEVMPTFLRKPRRLLLKLSSFMIASVFPAHDLIGKPVPTLRWRGPPGPDHRLRSHRIVQHLLGKVSLGAIGACVGVAALNVAVLAAVDIFVRADSRI